MNQPSPRLRPASKKLWIIVIIVAIIVAVAIVFMSLRTPVLLCQDTGARPDANGCCLGEVFDANQNKPDGACCPDNNNGNCFPPIK